MPLDLFYGAWAFLCLAILVSVFLLVYIIRIPYVFSKMFLPGTRHSPNSLTRIIFTWHTAQERPPKKVRTIFVPLFPKTHRRSLIFAQTGTFPTAISEKEYKNKRVLIFFCAVCQVFFVRFTFSTPPPERLQKNKSVLSA